MDNTDAAAAAHDVNAWMYSDLMFVVRKIDRAINEKKSRDLDAEPFLYRVAKKNSYALEKLNEYLKAFGISKKDLVKKCRPRDEYD